MLERAFASTTRKRSVFVCSACENYVQRSSKIKQRIIFPVAKRRKLSLSCSKRKGLLPLSLMASKAVQDCGAAHRDCMCHKFGQHFFTLPQIETMLPKINTSTPHIKTTLLQFETKSCFVAVLSQFLVVWSRFVVEQSQFLVEQSRFVAAMSRFVTVQKLIVQVCDHVCLNLLCSLLIIYSIYILLEKYEKSLFSCYF